MTSRVIQQAVATAFEEQKALQLAQLNAGYQTAMKKKYIAEQEAYNQYEDNNRSSGEVLDGKFYKTMLSKNNLFCKGGRLDKCHNSCANGIRSEIKSYDLEYSDNDPPSRNVPIGFARYKVPYIDPNKFKFYWLSGLRVAIPANFSKSNALTILTAISRSGPRYAGYTKIGDTLVPSVLSLGDRMLLSQVGIYPIR